MKGCIFGPGKARSASGLRFFGISAKNYIGGLIFRINSRPGDPFRDRLKMVVVVEGDGRWWKVVVDGGGGWWWRMVVVAVGTRDCKNWVTH